MTDAPFIVAGWIGTGAAVAAYALSITIRTRRALQRAVPSTLRSR